MKHIDGVFTLNDVRDGRGKSRFTYRTAFTVQRARWNIEVQNADEGSRYTCHDQAVDF